MTNDDFRQAVSQGRDFLFVSHLRVALDEEEFDCGWESAGPKTTSPTLEKLCQYRVHPPSHQSSTAFLRDGFTGGC